MEFKNCKQDLQTNYEYWYLGTYGAKLVFQVKNYVDLNDLPFWKTSVAILYKLSSLINFEYID